jgi:hypothetical protein
MFFDSLKKVKAKILSIYTLSIALPVLLFTGSLPVDLQQPTPPTPSSGPASVTVGFEIYLPVISRQVDTDLSVSSLEITQGVQTTGNSVPLVTGRPTVLRIYPHTNTTDPVLGVNVSVSATRNGQLLAGSPLTAGPASVVVNPARIDINSSFNVRLPSEWLSGVVSLQVTIDPGNAIMEKDDTNNIYTTTLSFNNMPDLSVKVIPINHYVDMQYIGPSEYSYIGAMLMKIYPVKAVQIYSHSNYDFDGSLTELSGWNTLLDRILDLHYSESAPANQIYYGLIPVENNGHTWLTYGAGYQGNGEVGGRGAIGLASSSNYHIDGGVLAAHEIGHNLQRLHSPCGVTTGLDHSYPYSGGAIGQFGLDVTDLTQFKLYPDTIRDIMSYCQPAWVSDYTYRGMYNYLHQYGYRTAAHPEVRQNGLLIRVSSDENGSYQLEPVYALNGSPDQAENQSDFRVEFLNETGKVIGQSPLPVLDPEYPQPAGRVITALVEKPTYPFTGLQIVKNGVRLIDRPIGQEPTNPLSNPEVIQTGSGVLLHWGSPNVAALIRYTTDQGNTWTALAIDRRGGEFYIDPADIPAGTIQFEIILADNIGSTFSITWENQRQ